MAREKPNYRDMLSFLAETKDLPLLLNRGQACKVMGISRDHLAVLIIEGKIVVDNNKIPIGSVARYLCG